MHVCLNFDARLRTWMNGFSVVCGCSSACVCVWNACVLLWGGEIGEERRGGKIGQEIREERRGGEERAAV